MIDEPECRLEFHRPFHWGVLFIGDPETVDIPEMRLDGAISSSAALVAVPVRHAQDIEYSGREKIHPFAVSVSCSPGVDQGQELSFDGVINLPSGLMSVGDADSASILTLAPGTYRIQIAVHPYEHPERVRFWYSPARNDTPNLHPRLGPSNRLSYASSATRTWRNADGMGTNPGRWESIPGERYVPQTLLLALVLICGSASLVMMFTENVKWGATALLAFGIALVVWIVAAAVGARRRGVSWLGVLWMSIKNLFRLVFDFLP